MRRWYSFSSVLALLLFSLLWLGEAIPVSPRDRILSSDAISSHSRRYRALGAERKPSRSMDSYEWESGGESDGAVSSHLPAIEIEEPGRDVAEQSVEEVLQGDGEDEEEEEGEELNEEEEDVDRDTGDESMKDVSSADTSALAESGPRSGVRRRRSRPSSFYTKPQIILRREKVIQGWRDNNLFIDKMEPEDLAVGVRNLVVPDVPHNSVLIASAKLVEKNAPAEYTEEYLHAQAWLTSRLSDKRRMKHDARWRNANNACKEKRRQEKREAHFADIVAQLESQKLVDFALPIDELERATRGIKLDTAGCVSCTAAIRWYLDNKRSEKDRKAFQSARRWQRNRGKKRRKD